MNPKGQFEFTTSKGDKLTGKICTWSLNQFCEKMDIPNVTELFKAITTGISIKAVAVMLLCAVEYTHRGKEFKYTVDDAMDWIDDIGGLSATMKIIESATSTEDDGKPKKKVVRSR